MSFRSQVRGLLIAAAIAVPIAVPMFTVPVARAQIHIGISVGFAPPVLPVYVQPPIPGDGYIWTPGYWAYGDAGYFWVPGAWVEAPEPGLLWTPGYWGYADGVYGWNAGYWGPHVGYYGGVNYGFGYGGIGFFGGEWRGGHFFYNGAVANFGGFHPVNVYVDRDVVIHNTIVNPGHASFNGPGGIDRQPSDQERQFANERHVQPTANQMSHQTAASQDRSQLASVNHGRPATTATSNVNSYRQVAQQHAQSQPISAADRSAGSHSTVNDREGNQQQRIANGVRSGQMTSGEAARADQHQANIDNQVHDERQANDGVLTGQERQQVNREQNGASRQIYNEKHNNGTQKPAPKSKPAPKEERR